MVNCEIEDITFLAGVAVERTEFYLLQVQFLPISQ